MFTLPECSTAHLDRVTRQPNKGEEVKGIIRPLFTFFPWVFYDFEYCCLDCWSGSWSCCIGNGCCSGTPYRHNFIASCFRVLTRRLKVWPMELSSLIVNQRVCNCFWRFFFLKLLTICFNTNIFEPQKVLEETSFGRDFVFKKARESVLEKTGGVYPAPLKVWIWIVPWYIFWSVDNVDPWRPEAFSQRRFWLSWRICQGGSCLNKKKLARSFFGYFVLFISMQWILFSAFLYSVLMYILRSCSLN